MSTFSLLKEKRFAPFFCTQFLGAFNDNIFKNALIMLITFKVVSEDVNMLTNLSAALFILPYFLFSASAGQIADRMEKSSLIQSIKLLEVLIMGLATVGFYLNHIPTLIGVLFLMGTQSAFFGPVKYGILPQHLKPSELVAGNGLVETGTFLAILIGTIAGGLLIGLGNTTLICIILLCIACLGYGSSRYIPLAPATAPDLKLNFNPFTETWVNLKFAMKNRYLFLSMLGISWFWFLGAAYLTQLPNFTRLNLGGDEQVVTLLLAIFSIGIALGSLLCDRLSGERVEIGLVPFGSIGLTFFGIDLYMSQAGIMASHDIQGFLAQWSSWHLLFDIFMIGVFGGFYTVPLYALIQQRSQVSHRSRMIAANNILNALLMVLSAITAIITLSILEWSIPQFFLCIALLNALVAIYIYTLVPEFLMRFLVWLLMHSIYKLKAHTPDIPHKGAALLVCNHVSFVDALILSAGCRRPIRFVIYYKIYNIPILNFIFKTAKAIPIAGAREDRAILKESFESIEAALQQGELVCIFPEGKLTKDGDMNPFKSGMERILKQSPVPVVPLALQGLWDSVFSKNPKFNWTHIPRRIGSKVTLCSAPSIKAEEANAEKLEAVVRDLRGEQR
ncbi:MAG: MFS transporter [Mariprofundaceae bacterium]|nr:MFS transporter [Mariprofundaceae bacterium]